MEDYTDLTDLTGIDTLAVMTRNRGAFFSAAQRDCLLRLLDKDRNLAISLLADNHQNLSQTVLEDYCSILGV